MISLLKSKPEEGVLEAFDWGFESLKGEDRDKALFGSTNVMAEIASLRPPIDGGEFAQRWYHDMIPHMNSPRFASFLVGSRELSRMVFSKSEVRFMLTSEADTALADQDQGIIYLPESIFGEAGFRKITKHKGRSDLGPEMTAVANGFILHESAHFAKSPKTILDCFLAFSTSKEGRKILHDDSFRRDNLILPVPLATFINVIEDFYIENWIIETFPALAPFIEAAHEFHFNELVVHQRLNEFSALLKPEDFLPALRSPPVLTPAVSREIRTNWRKLQFLNILICFKHRRYLEHDFRGLVPEYQDDFRKAQHEHDAGARAGIAFECFTRLFDLDSDEMKVSEIKVEGVGLVGRRVQLDQDGRESGALPDAGEYREGGSEGEGLVGGKEKKSRPTHHIEIDDRRKVKMTSPSADPRSEEIAKELERINRTLEEQFQESALGNVPDPKVITDIPKIGMRPLILPQFQGLGAKLRYAWTTNYTPGSPHKRGPVLVNQRLYRILTDGKVFSYREKRKATGKNYEICILVDSSGSMNGSKIREAMMAAYTAWESLVSARVSASIMTHTTVSESTTLGERPCIYLIADHENHKIEEVRQRASFFAYEAYGYLKNNYDGFAIKKAGEIGFTRDPDRKRFLFVISDGEPAGSVYHGRQAIEHVARQVQALRERGIDVISITVSTGAYAVNDRIYGPKKNVKADSPVVLDSIIEAMFIHRGG